MTPEEIAQALLNPTPAWQRQRECCICHDVFMPADPRQEMCPMHHREMLAALARGLSR